MAEWVRKTWQVMVLGELYKNLYWGLVGFRKLKLFTYLGAPNPHSMCEATRVSEEKMSRVGSCTGISASI